jgi:hypothetical protein
MHEKKRQRSVCSSNSGKLSRITCGFLRPLVYDEALGAAWPFKRTEAGLVLLDAAYLRSLDWTRLPALSFGVTTGRVLGRSDAPCEMGSCKLKVTGPTVVMQINKETSQGTVYVATYSVQDVCGKHASTDIKVVVKIDQISDREMNQWAGSPEGTHVQGRSGVYQTVSKAYMDAYCAVALSHLTETRVSPHFPLCYGATLAGTSQKRQRDGTPCKNRSQLIWMEYLPYNMCSVLSSSSNGMLWWSALMQADAAILAARHAIDAHHNDFGWQNQRAVRVPEDTVIWYADDSGRVYRVPTFGYLLKTTDFGRAMARINGKLYVSSEYDSYGDCPHAVPDNPSFDLVRLCNSIEDRVGVVSDLRLRTGLKKFFQRVCSCDDPSRDLLRELSEERDPRAIAKLVDFLPRQICHNAHPYEVLGTFYEVFGTTDPVPSDVTPYKLHK